jgi:hypothetical protein
MKIVLFMMHFNFAFNCLKIWNGQSEGINTTQWPKEKRQKDKQLSTKHYTENRSSSNTNPTKTGGELRCSGKVSSYCPTCDTRRGTVKRHEHHMIWKSCWTPVYIKNTNNINKTWTSYNTNGIQDESNIIFIQKS